MWRAVKQAQNRSLKQPCLPNIQKSDESFAVEPKEKIEKLKKDLLLASHSADLLDLDDFEYFDDLPML